ncbi:MAG: F0F1 ATP synthase subunit A [Actinobacteria bacterium]|mgnify:FL=1|nr:F0F1 ATP synthase subunit A [Actinomycetota bacterium]
MSLLLAKAESGFEPPSAADFEFQPIFGNSIYFTKPVFMVFLSVLVISVFFITSARKAAIVPSRMQFAGESVYGFVRKTIGEEVIGPEFMRFMPFLFSLFTFVLVNNLFGIFPLLQFPTMSRIGFPISITICTYLVYHFVSVKHKGLLPYLKEICFMPGIPKPVYLILTPVEIATYFITRPLTLAMRLFANMFAGHLLLLIFTLGGEYLLHGGLIFKFMSIFSFSFAIGLTFFEFGIQCLQAYIFTLLSALYIAGALADEH